MARQPDTSTHKLSAVEHGRIFSDAIEPILLGKVKTRHQSKPRLIMLGGQHGSGKTSRLLFPAQDELDGQGGFSVIDADHPQAFGAAHRELTTDDRQLLYHQSRTTTHAYCCGAATLIHRL